MRQLRLDEVVDSLRVGNAVYALETRAAAPEEVWVGCEQGDAHRVSLHGLVGEIEEGLAGYSLITIDGRTVSWRFRELGSRDPVVLVTAPVDRRLATDANDRDHAPLGTDANVRAIVLYPGAISSCTCRVDAARGSWWCGMTTKRDG